MNSEYHASAVNLFRCWFCVTNDLVADKFRVPYINHESVSLMISVSLATQLSLTNSKLHVSVVNQFPWWFLCHQRPNYRWWFLSSMLQPWTCFPDDFCVISDLLLLSMHQLWTCFTNDFCVTNNQVIADEF